MNPSPADLLNAANTALLVEGDTAAIPQFFTTGYVAHTTDREIRGHSAIRGFLNLVRGGFPDLAVAVDILVETSDRVAWQRTLSGTHRGDFMGFPATGRRVVWRDMVTSRFEDGRIAEEWAVSDLAERLLLARKG